LGNKQYLEVTAFEYHSVATGLHCCRHKRMQQFWQPRKSETDWWKFAIYSLSTL